MTKTKTEKYVVNIRIAADYGKKLLPVLKIEQDEHYLNIFVLSFFDKFGTSLIFLGSKVEQFVTSLLVL